MDATSCTNTTKPALRLANTANTSQKSQRRANSAADATALPGTTSRTDASVWRMMLSSNKASARAGVVERRVSKLRGRPALRAAGAGVVAVRVGVSACHPLPRALLADESPATHPTPSCCCRSLAYPVLPLGVRAGVMVASGVWRTACRDGDRR